MKKILLFSIALLLLYGLAFAAPDTNVPLAADKAAIDKANYFRSGRGTLDGGTPIDAIGNSLVKVLIDNNGDFIITTADGRCLLYPSSGCWSTDIRVKIDDTVWDLAPTNGCNGTSGHVATYIGYTKTTNITCTYSIGSAPGFTVQVIHTPVMLSDSTGLILTRTVVTNNTSASHNIGVLYEYDTDINTDDAAFLYFGPNNQAVETCYNPPFAYTYWQAIPHNQGLTGTGLITGLDAVTPDRIAFGGWPIFYQVCWDHTCSPQDYGDSSVLLWWNPVAVAPNGTRDVATYYGRGGGSFQDGNLEVRAAEPVLYCESGNIVSNPFQMVVTVHNNTYSACNNVQVQMSNGTGPGGTATISLPNPVVIPSIAAFATANVNFTAQLTNTSAGGKVNFTANVTSPTCNPNTLNFFVNVPPCEPPSNLEVTATDPELSCGEYAIVPNPFQMVVTVHNSGASACDSVWVRLPRFGSGPGGYAMMIYDSTDWISSLGAGATANPNFTAKLLTINPAGGCVNFPVYVTSKDCDPKTLNFCVHVPPCEQNCRFFSENVDMGDLPYCSYPTQINNPGHMLTNVAWLGQTITAEYQLTYLGNDPDDDGVIFLHTPWNACEVETVLVTVTAGPEYNRYVQCGGSLYLSAWEDYNMDGDFCDSTACSSGGGHWNPSEWIIRDMGISPGTWRIFWKSLGHSGQTNEIRFRFRLMSGPHGRYGFGQTNNCYNPPPNCDGTFALDSIGEVEDYVVAVTEPPLPVQLTTFSASPSVDGILLNFALASETDNDHFEIWRSTAQDGNFAKLAELPSQGNTASGHNYEYVDRAVTVGQTYWYYLADVDLSGNRTEHRDLLRSATFTGANAVPTEFALSAFPNPFNPRTTIAFSLPEAGDVRVNVFDLAGRHVQTLAESHYGVGTHSLAFDAGALPAGVYFVRAQAGSQTLTEKILLLK